MDTDTKIDNSFEFLDGEILIKIESLKIELDTLYETFSNRLKAKKEKLKEEVNEISKSIVDSLTDSDEFIEDRNKFETRYEESVDNMYLSNVKLNKLIELEAKLVKLLNGTIFEPNKKAFDETVIGSLSSDEKKENETKDDSSDTDTDDDDDDDYTDLDGHHVMIDNDFYRRLPRIPRIPPRPTKYATF